MTKLLVVKAHPLNADQSTSVQILDVFVEKYKETHPDDEIQYIDVFNDDIPELDEDILTSIIALKEGKTFPELTDAQQKKMTRMNELTQQYIDVDKIVVANALWNLGIPSHLKSWIDNICVSGVTFRYTETGAEALAHGKKALHIQSNGGYFGGKDFSAQFLKGIFQFVGVEDYEQLFIEGIDFAPSKREDILEEAEKKARLIAEIF